ncbi:MAG: toll/interleukin-1 receptor domain-containing protein, partial [Chromatiales bacterium]|nr:toll/interleukin-1 receptor domain-containing protein [Chromatiales bacterium]
MSSLFISYSRSSGTRIKALVDALKAQRHQVWFDQRLLGGQRWWDCILQNIRSAEIFVFAVTTDSVQSEACKRELGYAVALGKPILPLRLSEKVNPNLVGEPLRDYQFLDFLSFNGTDLDALSKTLASIRPSALPDLLPLPPPAPVSHLSSLCDRVDDEAPLDRDAQHALVLDIKLHIKRAKGYERKEAIDLLRRLKDRRAEELLATADDEIDEILAEVAGQDHPEAEQRQPAEEPLVDTPPPSVSVSEVRGSMTTLLRRAMSKRETWRVNVDDSNYLLVEPDTNAGIQATAKLRDNLRESKSETFKSMGWTVKEGSVAKGLAGGAAVYATSGLALLGLLSKTVRDYMMTYTATKIWRTVRSDADIAAVS